MITDRMLDNWVYLVSSMASEYGEDWTPFDESLIPFTELSALVRKVHFTVLRY